MTYVNPTVDDFQNFFTRDFPYGIDPTVSILNADISRALMETNVNPCLFCSQSDYTIAFLYLAAHNLCENLRNSSQGINGQFSFLEASKSVGSVNQSFSIPQRILDNPTLSILMKTSYGAKYLEIILPQLCGVMYTVQGTTRP